MASLTGMLPSFVPLAQAFADVITAVLTGSLYYVAASPKDPTYDVAPVLQSRSGRENVKKLFATWYERRHMKKIYSPMLEGLLALYLDFEWIQMIHADEQSSIADHNSWDILDGHFGSRAREDSLPPETTPAKNLATERRREKVN